jgi:Rap1a immunity proteins
MILRVLAALGAATMLLAACVALLVVTGHAQEEEKRRGFSADEVMKGCQATVAATPSEDIDARFWRGFCLGTVNAASALKACPPKDTTIGQRKLVVTKYIDARPNRLHESFLYLAVEALEEAWPCPFWRRLW